MDDPSDVSNILHSMKQKSQRQPKQLSRQPRKSPLSLPRRGKPGRPSLNKNSLTALSLEQDAKYEEGGEAHMATHGEGSSHEVE
jgi:hypothetical protein